jgi:hypothetical protein
MMAATDPQPIVDLEKTAALTAGDRLRWRGRMIELIDVVHLTPQYDQVVLRFLDAPRSLPVSVPARDLVDAEHL